MNQLTEDHTLLIPEEVLLRVQTIAGRIMTGLPIIEAGHLITKKENPVTVRITIFGVTGVQDHIIQDQTPGHIIGVTIRGLTLGATLLEDPVTVEAIPLPGVLHQDRLEANLDLVEANLDRVEANLVHLVQPEKREIKFWDNR